MAIKHVTCKLGNMKRAESFIIYPNIFAERGGIEAVQIQSDHRICRFDPVTRKGLLSVYKSGGAYNVHLSPALGAVVVDIPQEVVEECLAYRDSGPVSLSQI